MNKSSKKELKKEDDLSLIAEKLLEQNKVKNSALKKMLEFIEKEALTGDELTKSTSPSKNTKKKS